uniref:BRMS1 transcriptional repressor and anoikis regulator n=1 Tax=Latimeria chalumnae TaxID=7897 RepID=H3AZS6_LATCH
VPKDPEDMEVEADSAAEANGEEEEEEESEEDQSGSESETEDESSEMDDEDCERRRTECLDEMSDLEKQFTDIKETLFKERVNQVKTQLEEVISGEAADYLKPLAVLQKNMKVRTKVAGRWRNVRLRFQARLQRWCSKNLFESEKLLLHDNIRSSILERIQRLEDDRQSVNITSEWWNDEVGSKKNKKKLDLFKSERKKKPILVSGPYIVYLLRDIDILEDWTAIKKAKAAVSPQKRKSEGSVKTEKHQYSAKCEDGRLYYEGECFTKGQTIVLEMKDELPSQ